MNNSFDFGRMTAVVKKEIRESWQTMLLSWVSLVGIFVLASLFKAYFAQYWGEKLFSMMISDGLGPIILLTLFVFAAIAACAVFKRMRNKTMRLQALMLPASQAEKYAAAWLIAIPGFFVSFIAALYASQLLAAAIFPAIRSTEISYPIINWFVYVAEHFNGTEVSYMVLGLLFFQSFFLLGGIVWGKSPIIKTFASLVAIWFIYMAVVAWVQYLAIKPDLIFNKHVEISIAAVNNVVRVFMIVFTLFNYTLAYLRLREAEIINRW